MTRMYEVVWIAVLISGAAFHAVSQDAKVQLSPITQIRNGVQAWPLIINPRNEAERRINRHLAELNTMLSRSLEDCDANYRTAMGDRPKPQDKDEEGAELWTQEVKVTMVGPIFLSLVATSEFYCGGAHPYGFTSAAVFDLRTGELADPLKWFQPSVKVSISDEGENSAALEKSLSVPRLLTAYRDATHHECDDQYPDDQSFLVWPDERSGKVVIQADRLSGCCEACGIEAGLTMELARELGFSETFLQSIADAHQQSVPR